jgi:tRNA dimethylallyltransferase
VAALVGPTAAGKSSAALLVAERVGAEIVSVDSMQVYRGMDIGTAKPSAEEQQRVGHHMIDLADPLDSYSVAEFQEAGRSVLETLAAAGRPVLIVGGSGLHYRALVDPLEFPAADRAVREEIDRLTQSEAQAELLAADGDAADHVDMANPRRVARALEVVRVSGETPSSRAASAAAIAVRAYEPRMPLVGAIFDPGDRSAARIQARFDRMLDAGLLDEVAALAPHLGRTAAQAAGYRQLAPVARGEWKLEEGRRRAIDATRALASRQRTFFAKDPRLVSIEWHDDAEQRADRLLAVLREAGWTS